MQSVRSADVPRVLGGVNALAVLGEAERAEEWMARALRIDPENMTMRYNFACGLIAHLNDADAALAMLAPVLAKDLRGNVRAARTDPDFDALRDDPRFEAMSPRPRPLGGRLTRRP